MLSQTNPTGNDITTGDIDSESRIGRDWPTPLEITEELSPVEDISLDALPPAMHAYVRDISHRMQCPAIGVAAATIVALGSVIGAGCAIKPKKNDDWAQVPNLFGGIVGSPGRVMKSPQINEVFSLLDRLEAESRGEHQEAMKAFEAEEEAYEAIRKRAKDKVKSAARTGSDLDEAKRELVDLTAPQKPTIRRFRSHDATIEKLGELANENPRGIAIVQDEITGWLAGLNREGRELDRAFYLQAWNGNGCFTTDRIGRGTVHVKNLCLSLFGGIQPAKLARYLYESLHGFDNDGLFQRFQLLVYPDEPSSWELIDEHPDREARNRMYKAFKLLASMDFNHWGAIQTEYDKIPAYRFDSEAQELFYDWLRELETKKIRSGGEEIIIEHLSKYRGLMPSLALIFHLCDVADGQAFGDVRASSVNRAIEWCRVLESHAKRIYGLVLTLPQRAAASLAHKIRRRELATGFTVRDVYRHQWANLTDRKIVQEAIETLIEANWLRSIDIDPTEKGGRATRRFAINPKLSPNNTQGE